MKSRAIAAAAAALVVLAACGGSESAQPATRTKNAALDAATCAQGGSCKVGDIGPGGGIVFYAAPTVQPWGQYMEVSQQTLDPNFDTMWCDVMPKEPFPNADALGNGLATTEFYAKACTRGQLRMTADLVQGGYDDWSLPTLADAKQLYLVRDIAKIDGQWHYTATPNLADGKHEAWAVYMVEQQTMSMNPEAGYAGRAIRTFSAKAPAATKSTDVTTTVAPTTIPATTTPPTSCATGGACKIGDTGPKGGTVFYVAATPQPWGQYLEVAPSNFGTTDKSPSGLNAAWCSLDRLPPLVANDTTLGGGYANTRLMAAMCTDGAGGAVWADNYAKFTDWYIPNTGEWTALLQTDYSQTSLGKPIIPKTPLCYFTSNGGEPNGTTAQFTGFSRLSGMWRLEPLPLGFRCLTRLIRTFSPSTASAQTPSPTSTTPPTSCATGGACKIGDTGPKGGTVFYVAATPQPWGQYLEVAPSNFGTTDKSPSGLNAAWCSLDRLPPLVANDTTLGGGYANTRLMAAMCTDGAGGAVWADNYAKFTDWYIPNTGEWTALLQTDYSQTSLGKPIIPKTPLCYFTSNGGEPNGTTAQFTGFSRLSGMWRLEPLPLGFTCLTRLIRKFGPAGVATPVVTTNPPTTIPPTTIPPTTTSSTTTSTTSTTTTSTTTIPKTTTTLASCASGGVCKIGDTGPGGGLVFYVAAKPQPWGQYLEAAPRTLGNIPWCPNRSGYTSAAVEAVMKKFGVDGSKMTGALLGLGDGRLNSAFLAIVCDATSAVRVADAYVNGGRDDWYVPSRDELVEMYRTRALLKLSNYPSMWSPDKFVGSSDIAGSAYAWGLDFARGGVMPMSKTNNSNFALRPIRAFGPTGPASTSIASATIAGKACKDGGPCTVGDVGPGSGIVFYAAPTRQAWGQYIEMATTDAPMTTGSNPVLAMPWCTASRTTLVADDPIIGAGRTNTKALADLCGGTSSPAYIGSNIGKVALASTVGRKNDWYIPTSLEAHYMMTFSQARASQADIGKFLLPQVVGRCYWTSNDIRPNQPVFMQMTVGLAVATNNSQTCATRLVRAF